MKKTDNKDLRRLFQLFTSSLAMKIDNLEQYINVREALIKEKAELEERLSRIQEALGEPIQSTSIPANAKASRVSNASSASNTGAGPRRGRPPVGGGQSLREVVAGVLTNSGPLTKQEILEKVLRTGYKFSTTNPANSLGVILYGKDNGFKRENGRFALPGGAAARGKAAPAAAATQAKNTSVESKPSTNGNGVQAGSGRGRGPRKMSEEAKARIAAAARLRWKKAKSEGKSRL
ncbi:MAG: hypothetical protein ACO1QB_14275 [Verrucomicrobiales bacterium]